MTKRFMLAWGLVVGCGHTDESVSGSDSESDTPDTGESDSGGGVLDTGDTELTTDTDGDTDLDSPLTLDEAFACRTTDGVGGIGPGSALEKHTLDLEAFPLARCNDGTPAVFYVRRAADPTDDDKWLIQLNGGGGCRDGQSCADRFCGYDTNFSAFQMSSTDTPPGMQDEGILARRVDNPWGNWNQVFVHYCTSDNWGGQSEHVVLAAAYPGEQADPMIAYHLDFLGAYVFDAVIATLRRDGSPGPQYGAEQMPDLDEAVEVVLAGASAGSGGVVRHLDSLHERLRENNVNCSDGDCPLAVRGLHDSGLPPSYADVDLSQSVFCDAGLCSYEAIYQYEYEFGGSGIWGARVDGSCAAFHVDEPWRCSDNAFVLENHITTPIFVRMGQRDTLHEEAFAESNLLTQEGDPIDTATFASLVRARLLGLEMVPETALEMGEVWKAPGVFGPSCDKHETLRNDTHVYEVSIESEGLTQEMFDVWARWIADEEGSQAITTPGGTDSCTQAQ